MLSMLIDRLRSHADLYDGTKEPSLEPKLQRPWLARELREAADTIWQLRDDLQQANTENAELIVKLNAEHIVRQNVEIENDRLRELCKELAEFLTEAEWLQWPELRAEMRELGIEVS